MSERIQYWDIIKGIAIILVILGHAIFSKSQPFGLWIYSFHMPLFMIVSGYFFCFSLKKDTGYIIKSRFKSAMIPVFFTAFLLYFEHFDNSLSFLGQCKAYWGEAIRNLWFLWAYFLDSMLLLAICRLFNRESLRIIAMVVAFAVLLVIPDYSLQDGAKFMFPCFCFGYCLNRFSLPDYYKEYRLKAAIPIMALFVILLLFFRFEYTFYYTHVYIFSGIYTPVKLLIINIYRVLIGIFGSLALMCIVYELDQWLRIPFLEKILARLGNYTLGIYIFHIFINYYFEKVFPSHPTGFAYVILYTIIMTVACYFLTVLWKTIRYKLFPKVPA